MFVITPTSGPAIRASVAISPRPLIPISMTPDLCPLFSLRRVSGTPMWLFRFPSFLSTAPFSFRMQAVISLVVVLPLEPVTPTRGTENFRRCVMAISWRESRVSSTGKMFFIPLSVPYRVSSEERSTTAPQAPRLIASATKSWPSNRSPRIATKSSPSRTVLESIDIPLISILSSFTRISCMLLVSASFIIHDMISGTREPEHLRPSSLMPASLPFFPYRLPRLFPVVEVDLLLADDLVVLMPLPRQHDHVSGLCHADGDFDRLMPVGSDEVGRLSLRGRRRIEQRYPGPEFAHPLFNLPDDRERVLGPRVVRSHDYDIASLYRRGAHLRPLGPVPVAAAPEDGDHPGLRHFPHGLQQPGEGVFGVGVVNHHAKGLAFVHLLHPAGNGRHGADPPGDGVARNPQRNPDPDGGKDIVNVVFAYQGGPDCDRSRRRRDRELEPRYPVPDSPQGPDVRAVHKPEGDDPRLRVPDDLRRPDVVPVHHRRRVGREAGEQQELCPEVGLHVLVKIKMVLRQVCERRRGKGAPFGPAQGEGVGRDLHHAVRRAAGDHLRQELLKVEGLGRGVRRGIDPVRDPVVDGADKAGLAPRCLDDGLDEIGRGRLAVRAGDADEPEAPGRMAVEGGGQLGQRAAGIADADDRHGGAVLHRSPFLDDDGRGALPDGLRNKAMAVRVKASHGHEHGA